MQARKCTSKLKDPMLERALPAENKQYLQGRNLFRGNLSLG